MGKRAFGELELAILQIMKSGERMTVKDVIAKLGGDNKYNTVMTVMNRLSQKKRLARERMGLQYEYWLLACDIEVPSFLTQLKKQFLGSTKTAEVVSFLLESAGEISDEELAQMEKMIQRAREKRQE